MKSPFSLLIDAENLGADIRDNGFELFPCILKLLNLCPFKA
jgi:hypothetical protein